MLMSVYGCYDYTIAGWLHMYVCIYIQHNIFQLVGCNEAGVSLTTLNYINLHFKMSGGLEVWYFGGLTSLWRSDI